MVPRERGKEGEEPRRLPLPASVGKHLPLVAVRHPSQPPKLSEHKYHWMTVEGYDLAVQIHPIVVAILLVFWVRRLHFCDTSHHQRDCRGNVWRGHRYRARRVPVPTNRTCLQCSLLWRFDVGRWRRSELLQRVVRGSGCPGSGIDAIFSSATTSSIGGRCWWVDDNNPRPSWIQHPLANLSPVRYYFTLPRLQQRLPQHKQLLEQRGGRGSSRFKPRRTSRPSRERNPTRPYHLGHIPFKNLLRLLDSVWSRIDRWLRRRVPNCEEAVGPELSFLLV